MALNRKKLVCAACILVLLAAVVCVLWLRGTDGTRRGESAVSPGAAGESAPCVSPLAVQSGPARAVAKGGMPLGGASGGQERHFELLSATPEKTVFRFVSGEYAVSETEDSEGRLRSVVVMEDGWTSQAAGNPMLPVYRAKVACARGRKCAVAVSDAVWEEVACAPPMASSGTYLRSQEPVSAVEGEIYASGGTWPETLAVAGAPYNVRKVQAVGVIMQPAAYDFGRGMLRICRSCDVSVTFEDASAGDYGDVSCNRDFAQVQTRGVLNSSLLTQADSSVIGRVAVIVPDAWKASGVLAGYIAWREKLGYDIRLLGYPSDTDCGAQTEKDGIHAAVSELYADWSLTHLLLVGGAGDVPPYVLSSYTYERNYPGSDLVCSDVGYALLDGEDCHQDIFLSRMPVTSLEAMELVMNKLLAYEQTGYSEEADDGWRGTCEFIAGNDITHNTGYNAPPEFQKYRYDSDVVDAERQRLEAAGVVTASRCRYATDSVKPTAALVKGDLDLGESLIVYMGHGQNTYWKTSGFSCKEATLLANGGMLPFVSSCVCLTGNFGYTKGECLASSLLTAASGGACGVLSSTNETYVYPPMYIMTRVNDDVIATETENALYCQGAYALAGIQAGVEYCETTSYSGKDTEETLAEQMHLIGDCMLAGRFRPLKPAAMTAERADGTARFKVVVTRNGAGACGVPVNLVNGKNSAHVCGWTDANGELSVELPAVMVNDDVSVTAYDPSSGVMTCTVEMKDVVLDADGDGFISNPEILSYLSIETDDGLRAKAVQQWRSSGSDEYVAGAGTRRAAAEVAVSSAPVPNDEPFDCRRNPQGRESVESSGGTRGDLGHYSSCEELDARLQALLAAYPELCRYEYVGESAQKRRIQGLRIGRPAAECIPAELLIAGGTHGDERSTVEVAIRLAEWMLANQENEDVASVLSRAYLTVIPSLNPDGMAAVTRENANCIDLNRSCPDGVENPSLGMYMDGDSLWLDESLTYNRDNTEWNSAQIPETAEFMRYCCDRRFAGALMLHSGDVIVCYPYGNNENGVQKYTAAPDDKLFKSLAKTYVVRSSAPDIYSINAAQWYPVTGELPDWMYRYLGILPLTVELCEPKEPAFKDMAAVFEEHRDAMLAWMAAACNGICGTVTDSLGKPLANVKVTVGAGMPVRTDRQGRFFRTATAGDSVKFSAAGYETKTVSGTPGEPMAVMLSASLGVTAAVAMPSGRFRPLYEETARLDMADERESAGPCIVSVMAEAADMLAVTEDAATGVSAWRYEPTGGLSFLNDGAAKNAEVEISATWDAHVNSDHIIAYGCQTVDDSWTRKIQWLPAAHAALAASPLEIGSLDGYPEKSFGPLAGFVWNGGCFEWRSDVPPLAGCWRGDCSAQPTTGWYPSERTRVLKAGWHFIGVPAAMSATRFSAAYIVDGGIYRAVELLLPGQAYWVHCASDMVLD